MRHFLADIFFDINIALSGRSAGGDLERDQQDALILQIRRIQSSRILESIVIWTQSEEYPEGYSKLDIARLPPRTPIPIREIVPGVFVVQGTAKDHERVLEGFLRIRPQFRDQELDYEFGS